MKTKPIKVLKVVGRGPVITPKGTGLNSQGQPMTPGVVAQPPKRK